MLPVVLSLLLTLVAGAAERDNSCPSFEPPVLSHQAIIDSFGSGVLRIDCGGDKGSAYIIDTHSGYLLTAAHVVKKAINGNATITLDLPAFTKHPPKVVLAGQLRYDTGAEYRQPLPIALGGDGLASDLALLRVEPASALAGRASLDVSDRTPAPGASLLSLGFPATDPKAKALPEPRSSEAGNSNQFELEGWQSVNEGDSGSPLFDDTGRVLGTCIQANLNVKAHFVPSSSSVPLLLIATDVSSIKELDEMLRAGAVTPSTLAQKIFESKVSNRELIYWASQIADHVSLYPKRARFSICPIQEVLRDRRLRTPMIMLRRWMADDALATAYLDAGMREQMSGAKAAAREHVALARASFRRAIVTRSQSNPNGMVYAICNGGLHEVVSNAAANRDGHSVAIQIDRTLRVPIPRDAGGGDFPSACSDVKADEGLASLLRDYSLASLVAAKVSPADDQGAVLADAAGVGGFAIAASASKQRQGLAFTYLGDAAGLLGQDEDKRDAYTAAFDLGYQPEWVTKAVGAKSPGSARNITPHDVVRAEVLEGGVVGIQSNISRLPS